MVGFVLYWLLEIVGSGRVLVGRVCDSEIVNTVIWHGGAWRLWYEAWDVGELSCTMLRV
jgi:hypothetical protein